MPQAQRWVDLQRWVEGGLEHALPSTPEAIAAALHEVADDWSVELIVEVGDPGRRGRVPGNPKLIVSACEGRLAVGALIAPERAVYYLVGDQAAVGEVAFTFGGQPRRYLATAVSGGRGSRHRGRPGLLGHGHRGAVHRALGPHLLVGTEERPGSVGAQSHRPAEGGGRSWPVWKTGPPAWLHPPKPGRDPAQQPIQFPLPADRAYAVARGHHLIFGCAHTTGSSTVAALVCSPSRTPRTAS
jgi:hypothetical protein